MTGSVPFATGRWIYEYCAASLTRHREVSKMFSPLQLVGVAGLPTLDYANSAFHGWMAVTKRNKSVGSPGRHTVCPFKWL